MSRLARMVGLGVALAGAVAAALWLGPRAPERPADKVVFLGFDGVSPNLLEPLVSQGKLPALAGLMEHGAYGRLESFTPAKSAILWTSVATGKTMLKHGIVDWTYVDRMGLEVPYEDRERRVKTYWEILAERGVSTGTVNWWVSYPPAPILHGYVVSNAFKHTPEPHTVHPRRLFAALDPLRRNRSDAVAEMRRLGIPEWRKEDATLPLAGARRVLEAYRLYVAQDMTVDRISDKLRSEEPVEVFSTYFRLPDVTSHFAFHFLDGDLYRDVVSREEAGRLTPEDVARLDRDFARVLAPVYQAMDRIVAKYVERMDDRTLLILASDHGFEYHKGRYAHAHLSMDAPDGVILVAGPGVRRGARLTGARLFDLAPTILWAVGQPVAADMDGGVLRGAFEERFASRYPIRTVPTFESTEREVAAEPGGAARPDEEILEDLRTLGYIDAGGPASPRPSPKP